jgi:hypothetical protein
MTRITLLGLAALALAVAVGCKKTDGLYCCINAAECGTAIVPCETGERCEEPIHTCVADVGMPCSMSSECVTDLDHPYCVMEMCVAECVGNESCDGSSDTDGMYCVDGDCVECTSATRTTDCTDPMMPSCDNGICEACEVDGDCGADRVCLLNGSCADTGRILFASPGGTGTCLMPASPCSLPVALGMVSMTKDIVKLEPGNYPLDPRPADLTMDMIMTGRGATLDLEDTNSEVLRITATADVTLIGITIKDGNGAPGDGIRCEPGASLIAHEVTVVDNAQSGISADSCNLTLTRSNIEHNTAGGVRLLNNSRYIITNSFITQNGNQNSAYGGLNLQSIATGNVLRFNTIADNDAMAVPAGYFCVSQTIDADGNLIVSNTEMPPGSQVTTGCPTGNSLQSADSALFNFVNITAPFDYHIQPGSDAIDVPGVPAREMFDVDGDARPAGTGHDYGADEFTP